MINVINTEDKELIDLLVDKIANKLAGILKTEQSESDLLTPLEACKLLKIKAKDEASASAVIRKRCNPKMEDRPLTPIKGVASTHLYSRKDILDYIQHKQKR